MTGPKYSTINCEVCGREVGRRPGVVVVHGVVCTNPICNYQDAPLLNQPRDALVVAGVLANIKVVQIARSTGMSRQRIYQIMDAWKSGV